MDFRGRNLTVHVLLAIVVIGTLLITMVVIGTQQGIFDQVAASSDDKDVRQAFEKWMAENNRVYKSKEEKEKRFAIFKSSFEFVEDFKKNRKHESFTVGLNTFSDMTLAEMPRGFPGIPDDDTRWAEMVAKYPHIYRNKLRRLRRPRRYL